MRNIDMINRVVSGAPERRLLPDPGEQVPSLALPTIGVYATALNAFLISTVAAIAEWVPIWVTIPVNAAVTFVMFTVLHDAVHYAISSKRWVNTLVGRLAVVFVAPWLSFSSFGFIHIEHHRHSNDDSKDPDKFDSHYPTEPCQRQGLRRRRD